MHDNLQSRPSYVARYLRVINLKFVTVDSQNQPRF